MARSHPDDEIERLSSEDYDIDRGRTDDDEEMEDFSDHDIINSTSRIYLTSLDSNYVSQESPPQEERQRGIAKAVACVAITFMIICFLMVGASLFMSKNIDNKVRNSNEMLRKHNDRMSEIYGDENNDINVTSSL